MDNPIARQYGFNATVRLADFSESPARHLDVLKHARTEEIYEVVLEIQMAGTWKELQKFLSRDADWKSAKTVVDFGCGPGHLIERLCSVFPEKTYAGVDRSPELLVAAAERLGSFSNCALHQQDVYDFSGGPFSYAIARALLQHLDDHDRFLETARRVLERGGVLHVLDALDEYWREDPPAPVMNRLRESLGSKQGQGNQRKVEERLVDSASNHGFSVVKIEHLRTLFTTPAEVEMYVRHAFLGHVVGARLFKLPCDLKQVLFELLEWARLPNARAEWGLGRTLLRLT
ncbi:MAG: methyltransferase domain-containing protein [Pseudomonadota bacterium]